MVIVADVAWIKVVTDLFENRKIRQIEKLPQGDTLLVIWFKLLCLAGVVNDNGAVYLTKGVPYTAEMLATQFVRPEENVQQALDVFTQFNMITANEAGIITLCGWEKYQNVVELDRIREQTRNRVAALRERNKTLSKRTVKQGTVKSDGVTVKDEFPKEKPEKKSVVKKQFLPPSIEEVKAYCLERKSSVQPQRFIDYYTSNGWKVGRNPMRDWKAAVRNWEQGQAPGHSGREKGLSYEGREVDNHDIGC